MEDDCFAARLAHAFRRRFGAEAEARAAVRLIRARALGHTVKTDLFIAVNMVLIDPHGVFARSRA